MDHQPTPCIPIDRETRFDSLSETPGDLRTVADDRCPVLEALLAVLNEYP